MATFDSIFSRLAPVNTLMDSIWRIQCFQEGKHGTIASISPFPDKLTIDPSIITKGSSAADGLKLLYLPMWCPLLKCMPCTVRMISATF
jgi:hypothetical protein